MEAWFYQKNGQVCGPVSASELKRLADQGTLASSDFVRPQSRETWSSAGKVKGLFAAEIELELGIPPTVPATIEPSPPPLPVQSAASVGHRVARISPSAIALQQAVSEAVWKRLQALGLATDDDLFWIRLSGFRSRRTQSVVNENEPRSLWKRASEKLASIAESAEIQTHRYLIASSDGRYWITNQLGAFHDAWAFDDKSIAIKSTWTSVKLTITLQPTSPQSDVELAEIEFDVTRPFTTGCFGSPNRLIEKIICETVASASSDWASFPLAINVSQPSLNSFFATTDISWQIAMVSLSPGTISVSGESSIASIDFTNLKAWCQSESSVTLFSETPTGVQVTTIATCATTTLRDDAVKLLELIESNKLDSEAKGASNESGVVVTTNPSGRALAEIISLLKSRVDELECKHQIIIAAFDLIPLFNAPELRILVINRDGQLDIQPHLSPQFIQIADRMFLRTGNGAHYEVPLDQRNRLCFTNLIRSMIVDETASVREDSIVFVSPQLELNDVMQTVASATPYILQFQADGSLLFETSVDDTVDCSFRCAAAAVHKKSRYWSQQFGIAELRLETDSLPRLLIAPRDVLIRIWETRETTSLAARTRGISLGEMYGQYNEMRIQKFLTGVFGNYFLAQQQLEAQSSLDEFIQQVESAPPGALSESLETEFIGRLSILEISRHQLNRWLDRCTLMYPHQQAETTRRWLREAFDPSVIDDATCEQEAWKAHHQTRAELRQVQASMNRAMAEVGQNLNVISFAFPEEVRCAALAATRRAASMAGKGAMLAAFAGAGGQMLLGLGRASMGDPLGVAMLGTVGLSLAGRHLEKNAKDTEKKMRIRAYGLQSLQWWKVALETASIMAVECRHNVNQLQSAGMQRDRKLLEKMPREKLAEAQKRMAAVMRRMLQEELGNQFYEAIPGSGIFGWHIVDSMSEMTQSHPKMVLKHFSGEIPGSIAKG